MKNLLKLFIISILILTIIPSFSQTQKLPVYKQKDAPIEARIEDLINRMTLEEKIDQLGGRGFETKKNERLNIPDLIMSDGPAGVRYGESTAFPAPIAMAASWDTNLLYRVGEAMAKEMKSKSRNHLLAPCINIHRNPLGGRNFESYGEDPFLTSRLTVAFVKGVQSQNVLACTKHYACNNQEWGRHKVDVKIDERTLREIYLPAFKAAVKEADVWSIMAAYNIVNGKHCTENEHLLTNILKREWGFEGVILSDWGATYSAVKAANAGLDLEMPFDKYFGKKLLEAVKRGAVSEEIINDKVRRLLRVRYKAGLFDKEDTVDPDIVHSNEHKKLALEAALKGIALLKNENNVLPIDRNKIKSIAIIGPNAVESRIGGGGSSKVTPFYSISPLDGIKNKLENSIKVNYAYGTPIKGDIEPINSLYLTPPNPEEGAHGLWGEYFNNTDLKGEPVLSRLDDDINFFWCYDPPDSRLSTLNDQHNYSVRWTGKINPPKSGVYIFNFINNDGIRFYLNGKLLIDKWSKNKKISLKSVSAELKVNKSYNIMIEYFCDNSFSELKFGWEIPDWNTIEEAVNAAKNSEIVILFIGLSNRFESESRDRNSLELPNQDKLIKAVVEANLNTIVVLNIASPIFMNKWINDVQAIVQAWYPGQECGNAIADVLFGDYNPSGKLPFSFINSYNASPAFKHYKNQDLIAPYDEGIFVGYRYLDKNNIKPLFPFGYGLSYTQFKYSNLKINHISEKELEVTVDIKNIGEMKGNEIVQLYVKDKDCRVERPKKELKGFAHVTLKPGEQKTVTLNLNEDAFSFYDVEKNRWIVEPGDFEILIGASSRDIRLRETININ